MSDVESSTMASVDSDVSCEMFCLDLCLLLGCGDVLVLEGAWRVLLGRGASSEVSGCDRMRLLPRVGEWHRRCGRRTHLRVLKRAMES